MFIVDVPLLRGEMAYRGYNNRKMAVKLNVNESTFGRYLKEPGKMQYDTIQEIVNTLQLPDETAVRIFFHKKLT